MLALARSGEIEIVLDLSRLLSRCLHHTPTGVDRVEMAYARQLHLLVGDRLAFSAVHPLLGYGRLPRDAVLRFLDQTEARWMQAAASPPTVRYLRAARDMWKLKPRPVPAPRGSRYLVQASPNHLDRRDVVRAKLGREGARFVCLVHDLIPITYPEYARPGGAAQHRERMTTLAACADLLIANSAATARAMEDFLTTQERAPPVSSVLLGTEQRAKGALGSDSRIADGKPYFVTLGTIEPRKNHLLLLNIWREMLRRDGTVDMPLLIIIGRRGWENENVIDMIERSEQIRDHVVELPPASDAEVAHWLRGARALLMPSFAEGFGMPVAEAIAARVPVICSDIAALREVGGDVPLYLDPLDGIGWMAAVRAYREVDSPARLQQIARLEGGRALPTWHDHVMGVLGAMANLPAPGGGTV